ncbi:hypothetical protein B0A48_17359 [Cryoendolithus antarcticus]|uniref:Radical SAM core domain-containing protein n=1 Tax=Cryoendolithus antarcticus TaxID=1507870 RepID=A0A1V8SCK9_9PEZI|nr:hypothetical protein B0A48_17359 [Cryoendolithus antarcticus]
MFAMSKKISRSLCIARSSVALRPGGRSVTSDYSTSTLTPLSTTTHTTDAIPYWQHVWKDVEKTDFLTYRWQTRNTIERPEKLLDFLKKVVPERIPHASTAVDKDEQFIAREAFLEDVYRGMEKAPMSVRLTPHVLSVINWQAPLQDPVLRQFLPLKSRVLPDHPELTLDSLHEEGDSPVAGLVHRYPDKVLFLATSVCPVYCRFCTRSYAVGADTESVTKHSLKPARRRWDAMFEYIEKTPQIHDVVVSGGDSYYLDPSHLTRIGHRLLDIPHIKRFRFATKGLAVCPMRMIDPNDAWVNAFVEISDRGREVGKEVAMHTHFNHPNEITWATEMAARTLFQRGVRVRNQTVLLRGVNDTIATMAELIRKLSDLMIQPYYVYLGDMVKGVEDLRTSLATALHIEQNLIGGIAGFNMPKFVVDLPRGGGKRPITSFENYDTETGVSTWKAPAVAGDRVFRYHDPVKRD